MAPRETIIARLGRGSWSPLRGGDIAQAWRLDRDDGTRCFVKHLADAPDGFFAAEAAGLAFLAEPRAIAIPEVLDVADEPGAGFIALEWIEPGNSSATTDEELGRSLAQLHLSHPGSFGGDGSPAFLGSVPVDGTVAASWPELWAEHRLRPLARLALDGGHLDAGVAARVEAVADRADSLAGPPEPPARVHGDLWSGNLLVDTHGRPWLIDPSAHGGHRETDLAMMRLFGGFSARCFAAYEEVHPLADGWEERVALHQLVPMLVHVILFGSAYRASLDSLLARLGA